MCFYMVLDSCATSYIGWPPPAFFVSICDARFSFLLTMQGWCKANAEPSSLELC